MIKALIKNEDGTLDIFLGLTYGNIEELQKENGIIFSLEDLHLPRRPVMITWGPVEDMEVMESDCPADDLIALVFSSDSLERLKEDRLRVTYENFEFILWADEDIQTLWDGMQGSIGPMTKTRTSGFTLSEKPVFLN